MKWPWSHPRPVVVDMTPAREAADALAEAEAGLAAALDRQSEVDRVVQAHRRLQRENHLGPRVRRALVGEP